MTTHTPGPWAVQHRHIYKPNWKPMRNGEYMDHAIADVDSGPTKEESKANARLIVAAPELYAALHRIAYEPLGHPEATHAEVLERTVTIARDALALAAGKGEE